MATGTVVRFDRKRGYGFVAPDEGGEDLFVHQNNILMEGFRFLNIGERVSYELEVGEKGMKAVSVGLLEPRKEAPRFDDRDDRGYDRGEDRGDDRGYDRPAPRSYDRPAPRAAAAVGPSPELEKIARKQERLISLLVAKGVLAPGEIDGVEAAAAQA
jgi:cold shock CspA family protein